MHRGRLRPTQTPRFSWAIQGLSEDAGCAGKNHHLRPNSSGQGTQFLLFLRLRPCPSARDRCGLLRRGIRHSMASRAELRDIIGRTTRTGILDGPGVLPRGRPAAMSPSARFDPPSAIRTLTPIRVPGGLSLKTTNCPVARRRGDTETHTRHKRPKRAQGPRQMRQSTEGG